MKTRDIIVSLPPTHSFSMGVSVSSESACGPAGHQTFKTGEYLKALPLFERHVEIADKLGDPELKVQLCSGS